MRVLPEKSGVLGMIKYAESSEPNHLCTASGAGERERGHGTIFEFALSALLSSMTDISISSCRVCRGHGK